MSSSTTTLPISLTNPIHPIFQHQNFRATALTHATTGTSPHEPILPKQTYTRLLPALRLATHLLEFSLPFLAKVSFAPLIIPAQAQAQAQQTPGNYYALDPNFTCTPTHIQRIRALLAGWADRTRFYCNTPSAPRGDKAHTEVRTGGGQLLPTPAAQTVTSISQETIAFFSQQEYDSLPTADTRTAHLVELAFVLVHEQAHAVFHCRWAEDKTLSAIERAFIARVSPREPMYHVQYPARYDELGFAWSAWVHGGSVLGLEQGKAAPAGGKLIFIRYPDDVFQQDGEETRAQNYPFREMLLSDGFWRFVVAGGAYGRPSVNWDAGSAHLGWLGDAMIKYKAL